MIGESCAGVSENIRQSYPDVPWRAAAGMRNRVIHGYFDIDLDVVWSAAANEVPELARRVSEITAELMNEEEEDV